MAQINLQKVTNANNAPVGKLGIFVTPDNEAFLIDENGAVYTFGGGATNLLALTDFPNSFAGQALKAIRVNAGENAMEFVDFPEGFDGNPSSLNQEGATDGQAIVWNNGAGEWQPANVASDITAGDGLDETGSEIKLGDGIFLTFEQDGLNNQNLLSLFKDLANQNLIRNDTFIRDDSVIYEINIASELGSGVGNKVNIFKTAQLDASSHYWEISYRDENTNRAEIAFRRNFPSGNSAMTVTDGINLRGLGDAADYSATKQDLDYVTKLMLEAATGQASQLVTNQAFNFVTNTVTLDFVPDDMLYVGLNGQLTDEWTRTGDQLTVTNFTSGFIIVGYYKSVVIGGATVQTVTGAGVDNTDPAKPVIGYQPSTLLESNTVPFDKDYIMGLTPRTGNILFDFTNAKLGATAVMRHQDAGAFTFPTEAKKLSGTYDGTVDNYIWFVLMDKTASSEVVHYTISQVQP